MATSSRACRSRAPPSSRASRTPSTRWARGSSGSSRVSGVRRRRLARLRTPLAGLQLRLAAAQATGDPEEIEGALKEVDRLSAMVSELLLLSQAGEVDSGPRTSTLAAAGREGQAARFDGRVSALAGAPAPPVHAAPADVERTLDTLIENALNYGGGTVTLVARPGAIDVLDDGPGVDPQELEAVFERFHRGRAGRAGPPAPGSACRSRAS